MLPSEAIPLSLFPTFFFEKKLHGAKSTNSKTHFNCNRVMFYFYWGRFTSQLDCIERIKTTLLIILKATTSNIVRLLFLQPPYPLGQVTMEQKKEIYVGMVIIRKPLTVVMVPLALHGESSEKTGRHFLFIGPMFLILFNLDSQLQEARNVIFFDRLLPRGSHISFDW